MSIEVLQTLGVGAGSLVPYLSDALLDSVSLEILKELQGPGANSEATRVLIQALSAVG